MNQYFSMNAIQIKTTLRLHLTPIRIAKNRQQQCWRGHWEKGLPSLFPHSLLTGLQTGAVTMEIVWRIHKKLKIKLPYDPLLTLLGKHPMNSTVYSRDTCSATFIATLMTMVREWKQFTCPLRNKWTMKNGTYPLWNTI